MKIGRVTMTLASVCLVASHVTAADPEAAAIKLAQQWAFALIGSAKDQIEAGATDPNKIRKKATEDAHPDENKLRVAMRATGMTDKEIDKGIKDKRKVYLEDVEADIKAFQKRRKG